MASKTFSLTITADSREFPYEKRYPSSMTLRELKEKLELVVGISFKHIKADLLDKHGKFISSLTDDKATLEKLGLADEMKIHVSDISGGEEISYENIAGVEKYTIPEDKYNEREGNFLLYLDSVRAWKRKEGAKIINDAMTATKIEAQQFKIGDRCIVRLSNQKEKRGVVSYIGLTKFKPGHWIGVTYDAPIGKHDGSVDGERFVLHFSVRICSP
ncbi:unnamed protein product [Thelazia callipaeda]|uniref:CAP-Gly domain-containing protein n=1 Tax=Thelazia callipaeda TaxID=103827 RepID=A0A0N5CKJ6_THECL|nr:unnamed protein product [Thelazia callipaeda]